MASRTRVKKLGPSTSREEAARLLLSALLADVEKHLARVSARIDVPRVHDLRVASRRLRRGLQIFGGKKLRALVPGVKRLQDALGAVRDLQLQRAWLLREAGAAPALALGPDVLLRETELRAALAAFAMRTSPRIVAAAPRVKRGGNLGGGWARKLLDRRLARLDTHLRRAADLEPRRAHDARIAAKKLRDTVALLAPGFPALAEAAAARLEPLQDALGELHDADVRVASLEVPGLLEAARAEQAARRRAAAKVVAQWRRDRQLRKLTRLVHERE